MDIQEIVAGIASSDAISSAAASAGVDPTQAQSILRGVLEHVDGGGGGGLDGMVEAVAARTGLDPATVRSFLPQVMPLLQGHAANASAGVQEVLGGLAAPLQSALGVHHNLEDFVGGLFGPRR